MNVLMFPIVNSVIFIKHLVFTRYCGEKRNWKYFMIKLFLKENKSRNIQ